MLECVVNVSEGRDLSVLAELDAASGIALLDRHTDGDHHRSVFTLGHHDDAVVAEAVRALAATVADAIDLRTHAGVHPRLGALDVVPFVALAPTPTDVAVDHAHAFAAWWADVFAVPGFFYDDADPAHRTLPEIRRDAFALRVPDTGPSVAHAALGATAVGARAPMIAVNCPLDRSDLALAQRVATAVRARDGGLPGVRALAFELHSQARSQVSMNLVDLDATGIEVACTAVRRAAIAAGADVTGVELVGLMPASELERCSHAFRVWSALDESVTVEGRAARIAER